MDLKTRLRPVPFQSTTGKRTAVGGQFISGQRPLRVYMHAIDAKGEGREREREALNRKQGRGERRRGGRGRGCWWAVGRKLLEAAMGDSSGSVSIDVERIYFGGKVRARIPVLD